VLGSRGAIRVRAAVVDASRVGATIVTPNPFYQIYEGAALLAERLPRVNAGPSMAAPAWDQVPDTIWGRTQLVCNVLARQPYRPRDDRRRLAAAVRASDRYGFVIAADECYSEVTSTRRSPAG
jgi:N-succinyldiaminopimelate aminotransferase